MILDKSVYYFVQHAITYINMLQLLMVIKMVYGYCCLMIFNFYFSFKKSATGFYHEILRHSKATSILSPDVACDQIHKQI